MHSEAAATALAAVALLQELPTSQVRTVLPCNHCHIVCMLARCYAEAMLKPLIGMLQSCVVFWPPECCCGEV